MWPHDVSIATVNTSSQLQVSHVQKKWLNPVQTWVTCASFPKIKARDFIKYPLKKKKGGVGERESASRGHFHVLISLPRQQN